MDFPVRGQVRGSLCLLVQILFAAADLLSADILASGPRIQVLCSHRQVLAVLDSTQKPLPNCFLKELKIAQNINEALRVGLTSPNKGALCCLFTAAALI